MDNLIKEVNLVNKETKDLIETRLKEFSSFKDKNDEEWFSELCFCILTANSRASSGIAIQNELKAHGFLNKKQEQIRDVIIKNKHRFHNNKSRYIVQAREHKNIKTIVQSMLRDSKSIVEVRNWIAENIKGLGYKEASHFLRNTGHDNIAILDRHILNLMHDNNIIERPKILTKNKYLDIENKFMQLSKSLNMSPAKLDLTMWFLKAGSVLK